jgi:hypothetical protein
VEHKCLQYFEEKLRAYRSCDEDVKEEQLRNEKWFSFSRPKARTPRFGWIRLDRLIRTNANSWGDVLDTIWRIRGHHALQQWKKKDPAAGGSVSTAGTTYEWTSKCTRPAFKTKCSKRSVLVTGTIKQSHRQTTIDPWEENNQTFLRWSRGSSKILQPHPDDGLGNSVKLLWIRPYSELQAINNWLMLDWPIPAIIGTGSDAFRALNGVILFWSFVLNHVISG